MAKNPNKVLYIKNDKGTVHKVNASDVELLHLLDRPGWTLVKESEYNPGSPAVLRPGPAPAGNGNS